MLEELNVVNLGVIEHARIEPGPGLVVVTGETGAGKTLLLEAVRLLGGGVATSPVGPHGTEALVEGRFNTDGGEVVAARRLVAGRSRAYLDGGMVSAAALVEAVGSLVEIVGQHESVHLGRPAAARRLVDAALDGDGEKLRLAYAEAWEHLQHLEDAAAGLDLHRLERELEMARFQAGEISAAGFRPGDDDRLRNEAASLRHATEIGDGLARAADLLGGDGGVEDRLGEAGAEVRRLGRLDSTLVEIENAIAALIAGIAEVLGDLARRDDSADPHRLEEVERRLALLGDLQRKYGASLEDVLAFGDQAEERAAELTSLIENSVDLADRLQRARTDVATLAGELTRHRRDAADRLATAVVQELGALGFVAPVVRFEIVPVDPGPTGGDTVKLLFASDDRLAPAPIGKGASGGELSRLVLALRVASGRVEAPIVAFDEIDAGVGGSTALVVGDRLARLARGRQVLCVTHLPQVAAFADQHIVIRRDGSGASVEVVDGSDRIAELTRMLSGLPDSERGRGHAGELLTRAAEVKGSIDPLV